MNEAPHTDLLGALQDMRTFIARRFDEVSMEVNATSQLLGMAEDGISNRFSEVLGALSSVTLQGDGSTPHNVGIELESVIKTTEEAAHRIMDAAEAIANLTETDIDWADPSVRGRVLNNIATHASNILMACSFQDITGQRIGKTLENIRKAEDDLSDTLKRMGVDVSPPDVAVMAAKPENKASSQDDIDALFG